MYFCFSIMKKIFLILICLTVSLLSCNDTPENPNVPDVYINFSINPNSLEYYEINTVSGWMYLTANRPSRGLIVYRYSLDEFKVYERLAPNEPNHCGDNSRLIVEFPFVVDTCLDIKYSILDGSIITEGFKGYPLIQYHTQYDGRTLRIYN